MLVAINNSSDTIQRHGNEQTRDIDSLAIILKLIMAMLILTINIFVLLLFLVKPKLRKSNSNKVLLSLVFSDFTTGFILVLHVLVSASREFGEPKTPTTFACRIFLDIVTSWLQLVTMANLALIICERYVTLICPYKIERYLTKRRIIAAIQSVWVCTFFIPSIQLVWLYPIIRGDTLTDAQKDRIDQADSIFSALTIFLFVLLPMAVFFVIFVRMFREIKKFPTLEILNKKKEEKRVLTIFATMYTLFILFSLPYFLTRLLIDLQHVTSRYTVSHAVTFIVTILKSVPPFINPFVYILNKPDFRREIRNQRESMTKALHRNSRFSSFNNTTSRNNDDVGSIGKNMVLAYELNNNNDSVYTTNFLTNGAPNVPKTPLMIAYMKRKEETNDL